MMIHIKGNIHNEATHIVLLGATSSMRNVQSPWLPPEPAETLFGRAFWYRKESLCVGRYVPRNGAASCRYCVGRVNKSRCNTLY